MPSRMGPGAGMPSRGSQWRAIVKGLPISASWQDLKVRTHRGCAGFCWPLAAVRGACKTVMQQVVGTAGREPAA